VGSRKSTGTERTIRCPGKRTENGEGGGQCHCQLRDSDWIGLRSKGSGLEEFPYLHKIHTPSVYPTQLRFPQTRISRGSDFVLGLF